MMMKPENLVYEGKAKKIFKIEDDETHVILEFKDSLTAFNAEKKGNFQGKGALNLKITTYIFEHLAQRNIPSHFVQKLDDKHMKVIKTEIIPFEVVVRNFVAGSMAKRLDLKEGIELAKPLVEFYYKRDDLGDPFVSEDQILVLNWLNQSDLNELKQRALEVNSALKNLFTEVGVRLIDFKIEFGRTPENHILLSDEITPDSCRLWDIKTEEKLDKDRFRRDLGGVEEAYQNIWKRLNERNVRG